MQGSFRRGINVCLWLSLPRSGPRALWLPAVLPCQQPLQRLLLQLLDISLASPIAPGAKHNTSGACCFLCAALKRRQLCCFTGADGDPPGSTPPSSAPGPPRPPPQADTHLGLAQLQPGCSPGCCHRRHSPIAAKTASWAMAWLWVWVSWPVIAKGSAGTSSASPGGCWNSGAGVRRSQRDAGSAPSTIAC